MRFLIPVVLLVVVLGLTVAMRFVLARQAGSAGPQRSMRASDLATRLRLALVAGNPAFDYQSPLTAPGRIRLHSTEPLQIESRLEGAPDGYPTRLVYLYREERKVEGMLTKSLEVKTWFDCRFAIQTRRAIPQFEIATRAATTFGSVQRELALPPVPTGDPSIDARYQIFTSEPAIVPTLVSVLGHFAPIEAQGVHVVSDGTSVAFVLREKAAPFMGSALYEAEQLQRAMTTLAQAVGG
ncbi:MAG: hypothetical protein J0L92_37920 [Deltaproteobacteria bacterium]|nr:hypothetical protein [Deltaproteobacteria bacterium]